MPGTTTRGFSFAVVADKMRTIVTTLKSLADFLELQVGVVRHGTATSGTLVAGTPANVVVTFKDSNGTNTPFPAGVTPHVTATYKGAASSGRFVSFSSLQSSGGQVTGATFSVLSTSSTTAIAFDYIAIG